MRLTHNGTEWHGTFGLTLHYMVADLLSDGVPVTATITGEDGMSLRVVVEEATADALFTDAGAFSVDDIFAFEVDNSGGMA